MTAEGRQEATNLTENFRTGEALFREQGCEIPVFFQPNPPSEIPDLRVREGRA